MNQRGFVMNAASRTIVQIKPKKMNQLDDFMSSKSGQISNIAGLINWGYIYTDENEITVIAMYDNKKSAENATPLVNTILGDAINLVSAPPVRNIYDARWY